LQFDPYKAAENSRFNVKRKPGDSKKPKQGGFGSGRGGPVQKTPFTTFADLNGCG
jgi:hypothetical protein